MAIGAGAQAAQNLLKTEYKEDTTVSVREIWDEQQEWDGWSVFLACGGKTAAGAGVLCVGGLEAAD